HRHPDRLRARRLRAHDQRQPAGLGCLGLDAGGALHDGDRRGRGLRGLDGARDLQGADAPARAEADPRLHRRPAEDGMITGKTHLIAHLGYPTEAFKAPMIYNPWFAKRGIDAVVMPMGVKPADYAGVLAALSRLTNLRGALVTMPHKVTTLSLA